MAGKILSPPAPGGHPSRVVQGFFRSRPFSLPAVNSGAVQKKPTSQCRPGVNAFPVDLRPQSGGWPLPRDIQAKMEAALSANFSDVRVHVGPEASTIGAIAFTWGSDLHFAQGQYNPYTPQGQFLLGHELAHVVQQRAGRVVNPFGSGVAVVQDQALEAEADRMGRMASMSRAREPEKAGAYSLHQNVAAGSGNTITRKTKPANGYAVRALRPNGSGWEIQVVAHGVLQPVGSVQLTASKEGVYISNLKVAPEHRRQGLGGRLIDAALSTARSNGYSLAQLEARPDSPSEVPATALVSMYRRHGFHVTGISPRGNFLMKAAGEQNLVPANRIQRCTTVRPSAQPTACARAIQRMDDSKGGSPEHQSAGPGIWQRLGARFLGSFDPPGPHQYEVRTTINRPAAAVYAEMTQDASTVAPGATGSVQDGKQYTLLGGNQVIIETEESSLNFKNRTVPGRHVFQGEVFTEVKPKAGQADQCEVVRVGTCTSKECPLPRFNEFFGRIEFQTMDIRTKQRVEKKTKGDEL